MIVNFHQLFLLGLLTSSIHWLVARSEIARPLWSRARGWLDRLLRCPACSGWWLGLLAWPTGVHVVAARHWTLELLANGLAGVVLTPIFEGTLLWGLRESSMEREEREGDTGADPALTSTGENTPLERPPKV